MRNVIVEAHIEAAAVQRPVLRFARKLHVEARGVRRDGRDTVRTVPPDAQSAIVARFDDCEERAQARRVHKQNASTRGVVRVIVHLGLVVPHLRKL